MPSLLTTGAGQQQRCRVFSGYCAPSCAWRLDRLRQRGARLQVIGRRDRLAESVLREIDKAECTTAAGRLLDLRVAIDYSSRDAITRAAANATALFQGGSFRTQDDLEHSMVQALTGESGEVDLLIRTGGEKRLSDFLLWESAYAELIFHR